MGGGSSAGYSLDSQDHFELQNYTSVLEGKHMFKFGAQDAGGARRQLCRIRISTERLRSTHWTRIRLPSKELRTGLTPAQIRAAGGGAGQFAITYGTPAVVVTYYDVGLYFSDDWRWKPNFTVSYGLRFETQTDIHDNGDLAPRVSFAWGLGRKDPTPKTVLRAGWGMFYDRFDEQYVLQADRLNGTTQQQYIVDQPNFYPFVPPQGSPLLDTAKIVSDVVSAGA